MKIVKIMDETELAAIVVGMDSRSYGIPTVVAVELAALRTVAEEARRLIVQASIACNHCLPEHGFQDLHTAVSDTQTAINKLVAAGRCAKH